MDESSKITLKQGSKLRRTIRYTVAGVTIVILIFLCIGIINFYQLSPGRLFKEKFEPFELATTLADSSRSKIEEAYWRKDFKEVKRLNAVFGSSVKDVFLTGLSYLETDDLPKAIRSFQVVITEEKNKRYGLKDAAEYYLALALLKNQDYDQAIELMTSIYNNPLHRYKDKFTSSYIDKVKRLKWR